MQHSGALNFVHLISFFATDDEGGHPGPSFDDTINALRLAGVSRRHRKLETTISAESVRVVSVTRDDTPGSAIAQMENLAMDTGAVAPEGGVNCGT